MSPKTTCVLLTPVAALGTTCVETPRLVVPVTSGVFPEISAGRHRMTIRFLERHEPNLRPQQTKRDIGFKLVCCQL